MAKKKRKHDLGTRLRVLHEELHKGVGGPGRVGALKMLADAVGGVSKSTVHRWVNESELSEEVTKTIERGIAKLVDRALRKIQQAGEEVEARRAAIEEVA